MSICVQYRNEPSKICGRQTLMADHTPSNVLKADFNKFYFFFYLGFLSRTLTKHGTADEGGRHFFNTSLPLPPASLALRYWPGDCCGGLISAHS